MPHIMKKADNVPWRHTTASLHLGPEYRPIVKLLNARQKQIFEKMREDMQHEFWGKPAESAVKP